MNEPRRTGKTASVTQGPSPLAIRQVSDEEIFVQENLNRREATKKVLDEEMEDTGQSVEDAKKHQRWGTVVVEHDRSARAVMYKPTPTGWEPRTVDVNALPLLLGEGWSNRCLDCGGQHGAEPNDCPERPASKFGICPVCALQIWDNYQVTPAAIAKMAGLEDDPNFVAFTELTASTPESRIKNALLAHMYFKHPRTAAESGIQPPAEPGIDILTQVLGSSRGP